MEPPAATARVEGGKAEIWAPVQSPGGTREDVAKTLGIRRGECHVNVRCSAAASDASRNAISPSKRRCFPRRWRRSGQGAVDARRRHSPRLPAHRLGGAHRGRPRQERQGDRPGAIAAPRRPFCRPSPPDTMHQRRSNSAWAWSTCRSDRQHPIARTAKRRPCPHRLVPLGRTTPARLRGAVDGRRNRACDQTRSEGFAAGADRLAAIVNRAPGEDRLELRRAL